MKTAGTADEHVNPSNPLNRNVCLTVKVDAPAYNPKQGHCRGDCFQKSAKTFHSKRIGMKDFGSDISVPWSDCHWLVFDAVGTLIHPTPSVAIAYQTIAQRFGSRLTVDEVGRRFGRAFDESELAIPDELSSGQRWLSSDTIEVARWRWIVGQVVPDVSDTEQCFAELWDHFAKPSSWSCFDDVQPVLSALRQAGYRLAIASNFDSRLHSVCDGHQPLSAIERRFVSSETGFRKPSPLFYGAIASQCGSPADRILMVGDDAAHDVEGPLAAGMKALLLNRRSDGATGNSISSLNQLLPDRHSMSRDSK